MHLQPHRGIRFALSVHLTIFSGPALSSLDHLIGADEQRRRDVDAELFRRPEIDHQFEPGGLHHRQFRGLFAL